MKTPVNFQIHKLLKQKTQICCFYCLSEKNLGKGKEFNLFLRLLIFKTMTEQEINIEKIRKEMQKAGVINEMPAIQRARSIEIEREMRRAGSLGIFSVFGQSMEIYAGSILAGDNACESSPYDFSLVRSK